ncbi:DNA repair protein RecN [Leptodesmis sichuanensis]|uniref:DNA repair protein RecN n=1 Tax=Leptodesmis sichuanensis TaxID=2906798 RepID=UPI001F022A49|nr:DNA repair protein RecN [Leptodesmis sichuanensis]UIE36905.1 DNA repair protein RecN [Leptodesmis sichuanensis A121]
MLLSLRIENFALVDYLDLDLGAGLTVLTGETGAGKSIILDALDAALGGKVTGRVVRSGEERAAIEASFKLTADLRAWLSQQEIEPLNEDVLLCSREVIANSGSQRSRSRVNGVVVNKQQMEQLRDRLVEITAQGQTVQLGQPALQREWLDGYGGERLLQQREQVAAAFAAYQQAAQLLDKRRRAEQERLQQLDLFEYQLRELNAASLTDPDELELLEQEANRLGHSVDLQQQSYQVYQALYQSDHEAKACADLLGEAETTLTHMLEYDPQLQPILELVSAALAQVEEAGREINAYGDSIEADPERLQEVQDRIADLKQVCRKYGPTLKDAIELRDRLQNELLELTGGGQSLEALEAAVHSSQVALTEACAHLTQLRRTAAADLETRLVNELKPLAMEKVKFQVSITPIAPSASGADQITFLFSPNPGEPLQPLTEIASGGEMSRFLLALQASFSQIDPVGTLVFDEIDVGVSGRVSQAIAEKLYQLSQHHQVLCVTHQPIVAAMADQHLRVSKHLINSTNGTTNGHTPNGYIALDPQSTSGSTNKRKRKKAQPDSHSPIPDPRSPIPDPSNDIRTVVRVVPLTADQRKQELAQLAGGQSPEVLAFAESLLNQAAHLRQTQLSKANLLSKAPAQPVKAVRSKSARKS